MPPLSLKKLGDVKRINKLIQSLVEREEREILTSSSVSDIHGIHRLHRKSFSWSTQKILPVWERSLEWHTVSSSCARVLFSIVYLACSLFATSGFFLNVS